MSVSKRLPASLATLALSTAMALAASDAMPAARQNALIGTYCAVCHNDAHLNGGLSLEHFDAAHADPGVAAMLLSKLTSGASLETVRAAAGDPAAAALVERGMKSSAMGAAGVPLPDRATQGALIGALATEAAGASSWTVNEARASVVTASMAQEVPSAGTPGTADIYRLTLTCRVDTRQAGVQLSWAAGVPAKDQTMSFAVDGAPPVRYVIEPGETSFRGASGDSGTGAVRLRVPELPRDTLAIRDVFPGETVVFPFGGMEPGLRFQLVACFAAPGKRRQ